MSNADQLQAFGWVLLACGLGGLIGFEREYRGHAAGIRTSALVCAGAAIFTRISLGYGDSRIAAGVVQGIGFLGAGLILQRGRQVQVHNVTTAATIWVLAAIGMLVGNELWLLGVLVAGTVIIVLELAPLSNAVAAYRVRHHLPDDKGRDSAVPDP